jgi:tetratricopeptide (TPR) repeat protein
LVRLSFKDRLCLFALLLPQFALAQTNRIETAASLLGQGQLERAESEARSALETPSTRALALAMLGTIRVQQGKYSESVEFLKQALSLNPNLAGARTTLGEVYVLQDKPGDARAAFLEALRGDPANFNARFDLANLEASLHNFRRSLEIAGPMVSRLSKTEEGLLLLATDYGGLGKKAELAGLVEKWRRLSTPSENASIDFADLLATNGMVADASDLLQATEARVAAHPSAPLALRLGQAYMGLGDLERAETNSLLALTIDPNCTACELTLAQIAERQEISEKALSYLVQAKKREPENPEILFEFGKVCLQRNLLEDALPALEKAAALRPDRDPYVYLLASANVAKGDLAKAASLLTGLLERHPQDAILNYAMGTVYYLQGKYPEAESSFKRSLAIQPDQVASSYYLGLTYDVIGEGDEAVVILRDLLLKHPDHAPSYVKLGSILARKQQFEEAEQDLRRAVSLDPSSVEGHYQLGLVLRRLGKKAESEDQLTQWRRLQAEEESKHAVRLKLLLPN